MKVPVVRLLPLAVLAAASFSLSVACSSSPPITTDSGAPVTSVSWTKVYGEVITSCTDHHSGGATAAGNLDLGTQSNAYENMVGVRATGSSCGAAALEGGTPLLRVAPKSSATSLLYQKLVGTQTCGAIMPDLADPLPASQIALIKSWIDEGAPNN